MIYILHTGNLYGTERMALSTIEGMDEYEERIVAAPRPTGSASIAEAARRAGFVHVHFEKSWQLTRALLRFFLRYREIDVIGVGVGSSLICHWLARITNVRLRQLQVAHGGTADWHAYGLKHRLNGIPIGMVAVSGFVRDKLIAYGVPDQRISVIENFLSDTQRNNGVSRPAYDAAHGRPVDKRAVRVALVTRVDEIKRVDVLIDAVLRHTLSGFEFDIFGTGSRLQEYKAQTAGVNNLRFHGYVPDVPERLRRADLMLHLCPEEPFGLVILEAFLAGVLVMVPDQGGAGDLVQDGETGFRFRSNDPDDLARALLEFRAISAAEMQRIATSATALLDGRFSQSTGVRNYRLALENAGSMFGEGGHGADSNAHSAPERSAAPKKKFI